MDVLIHDVYKRCFVNSTFLLYIWSMKMPWSIELTRLMEYIFLTALKYVALSYCNSLRRSYPISIGCKV